MPTPFAMPVSHGQSTPVARGDNEFFQPVAGAPPDSIPGIEVFVPDSDPGMRLFACFNGKISWEQGGGDVPNRIELLVDPAAVTSLKSVGKTVEGRPNRIVYEHVDRDGARAALNSLLRQAYQQAASLPEKQWHPAMRQMRKVGAAKEVRLKEAFDQNGGEGFALTVVDEWLNRQGDLSVRAGNHIGNAAMRGLSTDPSVQRHVVITMRDVGDQRINPLYYLYLYFVTRTSHVTVTDNLAHPLFSAFPELQGISSPPARMPLPGPGGGTEDLLALGDLKFTHDARLGRVKWFYNADGKIEVEGEGVMVPSAGDESLVRTVWNASGPDIAEFCDKFQVPCELVVAIVSAESGGNRRAYRFEPMDRAALPKAASKPELLLKYDRMLGARVVDYIPTRLPVVEQFESAVVTRLACRLNEAVAISRNGKIKNSASRSVFLVDDIWRPVLDRFVAAGARTNHSVDVREERAVATFNGSGSVTRTADRGGRIRVVRAKLKSAATDDVQVVFDTPAGTLALTVPRGRLTGAQISASVDVNVGDTLAISVEAPGSVDLTVEWYVGVRGNDDTPTSANMWLIPDGNGSASPLFSPYPEPFDGTEPLRTDRTNADENMTWDEVLTLIGLTGGKFLSPGATQTLVSTAFAMLQTIERMAPGLRAQVGIPGVASASELISTGWLTNARHSLFVGIATMRLHYNEQATKFDLPLVHGWFHGGGPLEKGPDTRWGISTPTPDFIDLLGRRYNAAIELFKGPLFPPTLPTVRFGV